MHGHGTGDLLDAVCATSTLRRTRNDTDDRITVAVIGRPNVGKSSLINHILGENRLIVANEAGTTRDAIDTMVENKYGKFILPIPPACASAARSRAALSATASCAVWPLSSAAVSASL